MRALITVVLHEIETHGSNDVSDRSRGRIDEQADLAQKRWQSLGDTRRPFRIDIARTRCIEHETNRVGTQRCGGFAILGTGNAAKFDLDGHWLRPRLRTQWGDYPICVRRQVARQ